MALRDFPQKVTYWATTQNGYGDFQCAAPILINGRWEEKNALFVNKAGEEVVSKAIVYLDTDVDTEGYLAPGDRTSFSSPLGAGVGGIQIQGYEKTPDLRATEFLRKVYL